METEEEPLKVSQGDQGGREKDETLQHNSQGKTKKMGAEHVQDSLSPTTCDDREPCDPANPVKEPTHDTAEEAETTQPGSTVEPQTEKGAVDTGTVPEPIYSQYTPQVTMGAGDHTEQEGAAQEGDQAQVQELPQVPPVQEFGMAQAIPMNERLEEPM